MRENGPLRRQKKEQFTLFGTISASGIGAVRQTSWSAVGGAKKKKKKGDTFTPKLGPEAAADSDPCCWRAEWIQGQS